MPLEVRTGDFVTITTPRGIVEARAMPTRRIRPLQVDGRTIHQVALPFHWGSAGPVRGDVANDLIAISGEPNVSIHEGKVGLCNVVAGAESWLPTPECSSAPR